MKVHIEITDKVVLWVETEDRDGTPGGKAAYRDVLASMEKLTEKLKDALTTSIGTKKFGYCILHDNMMIKYLRPCNMSAEELGQVNTTLGCW